MADWAKVGALLLPVPSFAVSMAEIAVALVPEPKKKTKVSNGFVLYGWLMVVIVMVKVDPARKTGAVEETNIAS